VFDKNKNQIMSLVVWGAIPELVDLLNFLEAWLFPLAKVAGIRFRQKQTSRLQFCLIRGFE